MATLNKVFLKKKNNKRRRAFLLIIFLQFLISPLLVLILHQTLEQLGSGSLAFTNFSYNYSDSIKLLIEFPKARTIYYLLEIILIASTSIAYIRVTATIANVDTRIVAGSIEVPVPAGNCQHGSERFLSNTEKKEIYDSFAFSGKEVLQKKGGLVVNYDYRRGKELISYIGEDLHGLIIGSTGSGKTRRILFQTIWLQLLSGLSVVVSDVKGEIYYFTSKYAKSLGYKTIAFDLRNPKKSAHYNFLQPIIDALDNGDEAKAVDYTWDIVSVLMGKQKGDPLWYNGESATIAASILIVVLEAPREFKNLTNVYYFIANMCKSNDKGIMPLTEYLKTLKKTHPAKGVFAMAEIAQERTRSSFFTSALGTLRLFTNPNIAEMTSYSDFNLKDISKEKTILYMIIPDEKRTMYPLVSVLITQLYSLQVELANENGLRLPIDTDLNLDEVGNFPYIPVLGNIVTAGRSRGVRANLIIQAYQQLESIYKEEYKTIITNCQIKLYLKSDDPQTLDNISKGLGKYTVEVSSASTSISDSKKTNTNYSASASLAGRELLTPAELMKFASPYALCQMSGKYSAINYLPDLSEYMINQIYGLGDKAFNTSLIIERENEREERTTKELQLWGIWEKYIPQNEEKQLEQFFEGEECIDNRVSFLK